MATIEFLPERLNRAPAVFRGLTSFEMFLAMGVGGALGFVAGVPVAIAIGMWAVAPTSLVAGAMGLLLVAGKVLARYKRGRAETWFYRMLEMRFCASACSFLLPLLGFKTRSLILIASHWSVRRR